MPNNNSQIDKTRQDRLNAFIAKKKQQSLDTTDISHESGKETTTTQQVKPSRQDRLNAFIAKKKGQNIVETSTASQEQEIAADSTTLQPTATDTIVLRGEPVVGVSIDNTAQQEVEDNTVADNKTPQDKADEESAQKPYNIPTFRTPIEERPQTDSFMAGIDARVDVVADDLARRYKDEEAARREEADKKPLWYRAFVGAGNADEGMRMSNAIEEGARRRQAAGADRIIKEVMTFDDQQKADLDATITEQINEDKDYQIARAEYEEDVRTLLGDKQQLSDSESAEIMQSLTPEQKKQAEEEVARVQAEIERLTNTFNLASQEVAKRVSGRVNNDIINRIIDRLATRNMPQSDLEYIGKAIHNNSVIGMLYETAVKAASGGSWIDYAVSAKGLEKYDASTAAKIAGGVGALLVDSGIFSIASLGGAAAAGAINSLATRIVATRIAQGSATTLAKGALKETAKRIATSKAINRLASNIISQSVTLGSYDAASSILQQNLSNPDGIDWVEVLKRAGSGAASGAAIGVIGAGMQTIKGMPRVDALKAKGLPVDFTLGTVGLLAENAAFVGVGSLVSGEEADWQSFAEGLATLGILKGVGALKAGLHNPFDSRVRSFAERTLSDLRFTAEEEAAFRKAGIDADGLGIIRSTLEHIESVEPASSERKALSLAYNEAMASKDVPLSAKVKLQYIVTGRVQNVPDVLEMKIVEPTEYGEPFVVNSYDRNGRLLSISEFADGGQARAYINKYKPLIERNTIAQYENMVNGVSRIVALDRSVRTYAERENVDAQSVFNDALVYLGIVKGEPLSDERKVRAEEVISTARNASRNYLRDIIRRVAVRNEASSQEVWQALNVKPYLRTGKETRLVEDYVREIKDFVGRPIDIRPPQPDATKRISEESSVKPEAQPAPPQGPTAPPQNPSTPPRPSINEAMRARVTEAALSLSKLNSDEIVSVNIQSSPFGSGTAVVREGYVVMDEDGDIDRSLSDSTVVVEFEDGHRATVSIDDIAEVTYQGDVTDMVRRAEARQEQTVQMLDLINTSVDNGQSVAAKLADGTEGVISGVDEYENYIFTTKDEQGNDVSIPLSGTEIVSATPIEATQTEQHQSKEPSEDVSASKQAQEPEYDEDFPPLTEADFAPTIDFDTIKWTELSPKDWADTMRMYGTQTDEAPDAFVVRSARSYYLNSKNRIAGVDKQIATKDKEIEKLRAGLGRAINPQDTIKQSKRIQKVQSERDAIIASKDAIIKEMAQYEYALREYGIDINAEESLLRERDSLQRERAELVEADAELERTNDKLASQELKTIVNTEQNRNRIYNLYAERGVTPEQAGLRQAVLWDIATGNVHLRWEDGQNANGTKVKGLASELGLGGSAADKRAYKSIVAKNGDSIDAYVHSLWEQRGGYTADLDDIDMKNEVLDVLQSAPNGSRALEQLYDMLGISADREEGFGQSKADIEKRISDVDARIATNQRAIADFNKGVNDVIGRLERGEQSQVSQTETDENGRPFVISPNGTTSFGQIRDESGLPAAPIKLSTGYQDVKKGTGYGLAHIKDKREKEILDAGFASVEEFVSFVAQNYDEDNIRVGKRRDYTGAMTYLIQAADARHNNTLYIELSRDGNYWNVNSGGVFRKDYSSKKKTVVKTEPRQPDNAISVGSSLSAEDNKIGISTIEPNGKPTVSSNKDNTVSSEKQEIAEKVEDGDKIQTSPISEQAQAVETGADAAPQPKEQQSVNAQSVQPKIEDYGEVIAGARKDAMKELAKSVNNATLESLISLPFAKAFKRPNLKKAVEEGALRPQDARFAAAVMASYLSERKPKADTKKDRYRKVSLGKSNVEAWAEKAYGGVQLLKELFEAEPQERDAIIREATEQRFFDIDKVKEHQKKLEEWNPGRTFNGESYPINPVVLFDEVLKRLGDDIGEYEIPVSSVVPADSAAEEYRLTKSNGDSIFLNRRLRTFDDVVDAIVYLTKLANEANIDHPKEQFVVRGTEKINEVVGYYIKYFPSAKSMTPKDAEFKTKADADAFYNKIVAKGGTALEPHEIMQTTGYSQYGVFFKNPLTEEYIDLGVSGENKAELLAAIDQDYDVLNQKVNDKLSEVDEKSNKKKPEYVEVRSYFEGRGKMKYGVAISDKYNPKTTFDTTPYYFADGFSTRKEAETALEENRTKWEGFVQDILRQRRDFVYFNDGAEARVGEDYRKGKNVSEKEFANEFGFRGVQFGNWANQADRQAAVNNAYDSFMDLAKVLGVSPKALSLNGELGIAFGSRGSGKANAHYEADEVVINLTKTRGAGSLAHEWWHALDNYFARQANVPKGFATADKRIKMCEQMRQAFDDLIDHVEKSDYNTRSRKRGNYWGDPIEETARLFGEYVVDELAKRGERNHFLSRGIGNAEADYAEMNYLFYKLAMESSNAHRAERNLAPKPVMTFDEFKKTPQALEGFVYPSAEELKALGEDLRTLFDTVEERVDEETGNVALFSIRQEPAPRTTGIGYKVFVLKDGKLYPPMVANPEGADTPVGIWLDADAAPVVAQSVTGRSKVKAGGKGTQGGSGFLAYRPGWHLGEIPYALQFNRIDENGNKTLFPANFVWAEVEYANDVDYQDKAMSYGINPSGKFQHSLAGLPYLPTDGSYRYRTNPNPETDPWIITGAMRVKRLLTPTEVDNMVRAAGKEPQRRQQGAITDEQINALNATFPRDNATPPAGIDAGRWNAIVDMVKDSVGAENVITDPVQVKAEYDRIVAGQQRVRERIVEDANSKYNEQLRQFANGTMRSGDKIQFGTPSAILLACGIGNVKMSTTQRILKDHIDKHILAIDDIKDLPQALENPLMVYRWGTKAKSFVIITEIPRNDERIAVAVRFREEGNGLRINHIASVHGKSVEHLIDEMATTKSDFAKDNLKYVDKERTLQWLATGDSFGPSVSTEKFDSATKIIKDFENPKVEAENLRQCIVYHGSSADFEVFDHSHMGEGEGAQAYGWGTYVTEVNGIARSYAEKTGRDGNNLYTVDIPNDNGENYLKWNARIKASQAKRILDWIENSPYKKAFDHEKHVYEQVGEKFKPIEGRIGREVYEFLQQIMYDVRKNRTNAPKMASQALSDMGFVGMSYPAQYRSGGRSDGARNSVIFDEKNAQIIDHERYFRTPNGEVYGFTIGNRIYLDSSKMNPETPIHEYTELWSKVVADNQPELWARGKELLKETKTWKEVNTDKNYKNLSEDERASETLSRITAKIAAKKMSEIADDRTLVAKLRAWLRKFWKGLKGTFEKWTDKDLAKIKVDDFVMMPLRDLIDKVDLTKYTKAKAERTNETRLAQNRAELDAIQAERDAIITKAKADGTYMKAPNGKPTRLTEREWADVRTPRFKQWFGDWEKAHTANRLLYGKSVVKLSGEEFAKDGTPLTTKVTQFYADNFGGSVVREGLGEVLLNERSVRDSISHGIGRAKSVAFAAVPNIIKDGIVIDTQTDWKNRGYDSATIAAPVSIGDKDYAGIVVVKRGNGSNRFYLHEVFLKESLLNGDFQTSLNTGKPSGDIAKLIKDFVLASSNASKVVDENGEPLAVYHGTSKRWYGGKFNTFDTDNHPVWFTPDRSYAEEYSTAEGRKQHRLDRPQVYSTFLNMRNVKDVGRIDYGGTNALVEFAKQTGIPLEDIKAINAERYREAFGEEVSNPNDIRMVYDLTNSRQFKDYLSQKGYDGMRALEGKNATFAAFYPNQVKSATDNIGTYDTRENDIRFMFAGEKGAEVADRAQEATARMDNLAVARDMEQSWKDAAKIKLATGWERGADGKWRYEIPDAKIKDTLEMEGKSFKRDESNMLWTSGKLGNVVEAPDLFDAYPQLKDVRLETDEILNGEGSNGYYDPKRNVIVIHADKLKYLNGILNHEIQHAIQRIEGFAQGGNSDMLQERNAERVNELQRLRSEIEQEVAEGNTDREEQLEEIDLELGDYDPEIGGYDYYRHLSGEVEARNVERRMKMTPEERRTSLASTTEDVAREDQIFLYDNLDVAGRDARISESAEEDGTTEGGEAANQSRVDELVARLASLQAQARNRNQDVRALTAEVIKFVKDKTNDVVLKNLGEQRFRSIMNGVQAALAKITATRATSEWQMAEIRKALDKIDTRITEALIKDNREAIEKLLNLRVYKFNPMGVKMGNRISENTRQVFDQVQAGITLKSKKWSDEENRYVYYYTLTEKAANTSETLADIEREMYELPPEDNSVMHKIAAVQILKRYNDAIVIYDTINEIEQDINQKTAERSAAFRAKQEALEANNLNTHAEKLVKWRNLKGEIAGLQADLLNRKHLYNDALATFRQGLETLIEGGRNAWIDAVHKEAEHRMNLMRTAFSSIRVPSAIPYKKTNVGDEVVEIKENRNNELKVLVSNALPGAATFDSMLRAICINDIGNRYGLYDEIMGGEEGLVFASDNEYKNKQKMFSAVEEQIKAFHLGKNMNDLIAITKKPSGMYITNKGNKGNIELTIGELMYIYASSRQEQGRKMLINAGIDEMYIDTMADHLVEVYPNEWRFVNWVTDEFLPTQRYERYNGLYEDLYKTQMPDTPHYFPLVVNKEQLYKAEEIGEGDVSVLPTSTVGSIIARREHNYGLNLDTNFVGQLISHINDMEHWYAFAKPIKQINTLLSSTQFRNVVEAQAKGAVSLLKEVANIAVGGQVKSRAGALAKPLKVIARNDIASNITFRFNTALKQTLSYPAYFAYSASPRYWLYLARAFNPMNIPANWKWAINELPTVKERWESRSAGFDQLNANDFSVMYGRIVGKAVSTGMLANSTVDLLTCTIGARAVYEFEYNNNIKSGMTASAAEVDAKYRAAVFLNQTQQSGNNIFLSRIQKDGAFSQFMAYRNANLGYARLETHAIAEAMRAVDKDTKRRRIAARKDFYKRAGMNNKQAEHKAKHDHWQNFLRAVLALGVFGGVLPYLWSQGGKGLLGYRPDDDDDEGSGISFVPYLSDYPFYGPAISDVISGVSDYQNQNLRLSRIKLISSPTLETFLRNAGLIYDRLSSDGKKADRYDTTVAFSVATLAMRYGIALDPKTFENMYHGVKGMARDGMDYEDIMEIFNVPRSSVKAIVGRIREGETKEEYMQRLSFANRRIRSRSNKVADKKIEEQYFEALNNKFYKEMGISPSEVDKFEKKVNKAKNRLHLTAAGYVEEDYLDDYEKMPEEQAALVDSLGNRIYDLQWYDYGLKTAIEPDSIYKADLKSRYEVLKQLNVEYDKYMKKYGN